MIQPCPECRGYRYVAPSGYAGDVLTVGPQAWQVCPLCHGVGHLVVLPVVVTVQKPWTVEKASVN